MKIYVTTDTHFSHKQLIEYGRPEDFEDKIKKGLLDIKKIDLLIHLWDVCIWQDKINNNWFKNLDCKRVLVKWNHDRKSNNWYMDNGWDLACERFDIDIFGKRLAFTHIPIVRDWYFDLNIHWHFHDTQNRHPEDLERLSWYNKLLALEYTDYKPVKLQEFVL